jgi:hypothetical protein
VAGRRTNLENVVDWKQQLLNRALLMMQDPRVAKVIQDPRVMSGLMGVLKLRTDLQRSLNDGVRKVAGALHLASEAEVRELRRAVSRLETELERARSQRRDPSGDRPLS